MSSGVSIKDIARQVGVSATTVSRALRDRPGMSSEVKQRIKDVAEQLGYVPNIAGSALVTGRDRTVLYVVADNPTLFPSLFQMEVLEGLVDAVSPAGYHVTVLTERLLHDTGGTAFDAFRRFRAGGAVLLLLSAEDPSPPPDFPFPVVIVNKVLPGVRADFVIAEDETGAYKATAHLIEQGHVRIGHIAGTSRNYNSLRRLAGFKRALSDAGIRFENSMVVESQLGREAAADATHRLLHQMPDVTAIFCTTDEMALGTRQALRENGLSIPDDVAIASFDDDSFADVVDPPLTTVRKPRYAMGRAAGRLLVSRLEGDEEQGEDRESMTLTLGTKLIVRESSGVKPRASSTTRQRAGASGARKRKRNTRRSAPLRS